MAHLEQKLYCERVREVFPAYFRNVRVLDAGSQDINGNNRYLFENCEYLGIDVGPGPNVDLVCPMHKHEPSIPYDTIVSTEAFEHDEFFEESLRNISKMLRPGGLFFMTCASEGRPEHGTHDSHPGCSVHTLDFYENRNPLHFAKALDLPRTFSLHSFEMNTASHDLYFFGVKHQTPPEEDGATMDSPTINDGHTGKTRWSANPTRNPLYFWT
jgi:SAM-dependent methyltransferase